jgi:SnoaL-like domain
MNTNESIISGFYEAFQQKNAAFMRQSYTSNAVFNDEVFCNLQGNEIGNMWEMLIKNGKDLDLEYEILGSSENVVNASWRARYTFSKTGRVVVNHIRATFVLENGKIKTHVDSFHFYNWAKQAFGLSGFLIGWTPFFKRKVQQTALKSLNRFVAQKGG